MKTALAIVELDENDLCLPEPLKILEEAAPEEIIANLDKLINGYPVRDSAYEAILRLRFLAEKLYQDTASPDNPTAGYTNMVFFLILSNWDRTVGKIKDSIKSRHKDRLEAEKNYLKKVFIMGQNEKESLVMNTVSSALDFFKEFLKGKISESFNPKEVDAVLFTLANNKLAYTAELTGINQHLRAVFVNPDAAFENLAKINEFFEKVQEGIAFLEKSDFHSNQ